MNYKKIFFAVLICLLSVCPVFAGDVTAAQLEYNKGIDFYKIGQYDKSMESFRKAISLDPEYIDAYYNLGSILEYLGQDEAALTVFKQIIVRKPTDYDAVFKAAKLSNKLGETDKARSFLALIPNGAYINPEMQKLKQEIGTVQAEKPVDTNGVYENLPSPTGITSDNAGNLYVAGFSDNVIYKITPIGNKVVFLKDKRLNGPIGIAADDFGNIYIANYNANTILKADKTGFISTLIKDIQKPYCIYIKNGILYASSQGSNSVIRYKL